MYILNYESQVFFNMYIIVFNFSKPLSSIARIEL